MKGRRVIGVLGTTLLLCLGWFSVSMAGEIVPVPTSAIHVDIPVKLEKANVVFNMDHLAFSGDMPVGIKYMHLLALRFKKMGTRGRIIGIFHGAAAYMTLKDKSYNVDRKVSTGNPYKGLIKELLKQGVQIEECAVSMKDNNWTNEDLLPGVKVNGGAVSRLIELVQNGYIQIQP